EVVVAPVTTEDADTLDQPAAKVSGFEGKPGQTLLVDGRLLVGLGPGADVDADAVRRASAVAARAVSRCERVATTLPSEHAQAVAEGFALGAYSFTPYQSKPEP